MSHQINNTLRAGKALAEAKGVLILVHGRGGNAQGILPLAEELGVAERMHVIAPQATGNTWYPYSFMAAEAQNQPFLDAALALLHELVEECVQSGIDAKHIHIAGFSQGACLAAEFVARRGEAMGSLHVYSGGLIGQDFQPEKYSGKLTDMPAFIGCSDVDAHIPLSRVKESTAQFRAMGANVDERIYAGAPHSIFEDELQASRGILG